MQQDTSMANILAEIKDIKKLIICALSHTGVSQKKVAVALDLNQSSISRMFKKTERKKRKRSAK